MQEKVLLKLTNIHKQFPGVYALKNVNLSLLSGEVHALLGENGAGKSTLIKIIGGIYQKNQGEIYINNTKCEINSVQDAKNHGISIIHQELVLVPHITVAENIFLGREPLNKLGLINRQKLNNDAAELLKSFELNISPQTLIANLTIAQQQMVEIIKAVSFNAKILIMDEPTSSLSDKEVDFMFATMRRLLKDGVGIIYISHKMSELDIIADKVTVLRDGEYIDTLEVKKTTRDELISLMVGRAMNNYYTRTENKIGDNILEVKNLSTKKLLKNINFSLRKGELLGFAGLIGAGRSEVMKCIFGLDSYTSGEIFIDSKLAKINEPLDAIDYGIALVPEDRKHEALFPVKSVQFNLTIDVLNQFINSIFVDNKKEDEICYKYIDALSIKTPSLAQPIGNLSGGNQQKVIFGRWLANNPKILILDEPTRGVDVGAKAEIYSIIDKLLKTGMAIIMISSELPEIINMSDRVIVMNDGEITGVLNKSELTQEAIMQLAAN